MTCQLVQILVVTMVLTHAVLTLRFDFLPEVYESMIDEDAVLKSTKLLAPAVESSVILVDMLSKKVDTAIEKLTAINLEQFDNNEEIYLDLRNFFDTRGIF